MKIDERKLLYVGFLMCLCLLSFVIAVRFTNIVKQSSTTMTIIDRNSVSQTLYYLADKQEEFRASNIENEYGTLEQLCNSLVKEPFCDNKTLMYGYRFLINKSKKNGKSYYKVEAIPQSIMLKQLDENELKHFWIDSERRMVNSY